MTTTLPFSNPTTSLAAAKSMAEHADSILERVYTHILAQGLRGATMDEVEVALELDGSTVRPRFYTLRGLDKETKAGAYFHNGGNARDEIGTKGALLDGVGGEVMDCMTPTDIADKTERLARIRCLIRALQNDIDSQILPPQVRRESLERVARWELAAREMAKELARMEAAL